MIPGAIKSHNSYQVLDTFQNSDIIVVLNPGTIKQLLKNTEWMS